MTWEMSAEWPGMVYAHLVRVRLRLRLRVRVRVRVGVRVS